MTANVTTNPIIERLKVYSDGKQEKAQTDFDNKKAEYEAAMKKLNAFQDEAWFAQRNLNYHKNSPEYNKYEKQYCGIKSNVSNYEIETSVLRASLGNRLSSLQHANQFASIASVFDCSK